MDKCTEVPKISSMFLIDRKTFEEIDSTDVKAWDKLVKNGKAVRIETLNGFAKLPIKK